MKKLADALAGLEFGDLSDSLREEVASLASELGMELAIQNSDPLIFLLDCYVIEQDQKKRSKIQETCKKIVLSVSSISSRAPQRAHKAKRPPVSEDKPLSAIRSTALGPDHIQEFRSYFFNPTKTAAKRITQVAEEAVEKNWDFRKTEEACLQAKLNKSDTAFVLTFSQIYWKAFEDEPDLREEPGSMVKYLMRESVSRLNSTGLCSYFISLIADDGKPAGFISGAIASTGKYLRHLGIDESAQDLGVNFIGYLGIAREFQARGLDKTLFAEPETLAAANSLRIGYTILQVDKPEVFREELAGLEKSGKRDAETREEMESLRRRIKASTILNYLYGNRHEMQAVPGLRTFEIITDYEDKSSPLQPPEELPKLDLFVRSNTSGKSSMPYSDLETVLTFLYGYYEALPGRKIAGTGTEALNAYVAYSLEKVRKGETITLVGADTLDQEWSGEWARGAAKGAGISRN